MFTFVVVQIFSALAAARTAVLLHSETVKCFETGEGLAAAPAARLGHELWNGVRDVLSRHLVAKSLQKSRIKSQVLSPVAFYNLSRQEKKGVWKVVRFSDKVAKWATMAARFQPLLSVISYGSWLRIQRRRGRRV